MISVIDSINTLVAAYFIAVSTPLPLIAAMRLSNVRNRIEHWPAGWYRYQVFHPFVRPAFSLYSQGILFSPFSMLSTLWERGDALYAFIRSEVICDFVCWPSILTQGGKRSKLWFRRNSVWGCFNSEFVAFLNIYVITFICHKTYGYSY